MQTIIIRLLNRDYTQEKQRQLYEWDQTLLQENNVYFLVNNKLSKQDLLILTSWKLIRTIASSILWQWALYMSRNVSTCVSEEAEE